MPPYSAFAIELAPSLQAALRRGEQTAFAEVYRLFERPAYSLALRMLGDIDDALEALHDAFLQAFSRIASFRGEAPFWGWFRQITVNAALMKLRQRRPEQALDEFAFEVEVGDNQTKLGLPIAAAEQQTLERALARLPALTRSVIWLYHAEGLTHEEIGAAMGRSVSFSKSQLARGTRRLRQLLEVTVEASHV